MTEKISILGVELKDYSMEDAARVIEEYLNNDVLNTMCLVTKEMLVYAGENPEYRECLEAMDIHVVLDSDIFSAAGITGEERLKKADDRQRWKLFIDTVVKEHKSCFLLAQTADDLEKFRETLQEKFPDLVIAGAYAAEDAGEEPEVIVNEINGILPDVIFSTLDQPFQELFLHEQRAKMGARVWFGFGPMGSGGRFGEENWLARLIGKTVFHRKVQQYNHMVKDEEEYEEALAEEAAEELPAKEDGEAGAEK